VLILYELRRPEPLIDPRFFRSAPFAGASAIAICVFAAFGGFLFLSTIYLQSARGLSPFHAGLYMLPMAATMLIFAPLSGRLVGNRGSRPSLLVGGVALIVATVMLTRVEVHTSTAYVLGAYAVFGFGFGLVNPPITNTAVSGMPQAQAGVAAAIASTSRQVGATLGVAIAGAIAGSGLSATGQLGPGFALASHPAWWIMVGLGCGVLLLGGLTTTRWADSTAQSTAERLRERSPDAPAWGPRRAEPAGHA
jgi:MFS family permease